MPGWAGSAVPCAVNNGWRAGVCGAPGLVCPLPVGCGKARSLLAGTMCCRDALFGNATWQIFRVNRELWSCAVSPSAWVQVPQGGRQGVIRADELCSAPLGVSGMEKCALGTLPDKLGWFPWCALRWWRAAGLHSDCCAALLGLGASQEPGEHIAQSPACLGPILRSQCIRPWGWCDSHLSVGKSGAEFKSQVISTALCCAGELLKLGYSSQLARWAGFPRRKHPIPF